MQIKEELQTTTTLLQLKFNENQIKCFSEIPTCTDVKVEVGRQSMKERSDNIFIEILILFPVSEPSLVVFIKNSSDC